MMVGKYILSIDQGTTSSRAVLFDSFGGVAGMGQREFPQIYPQPGYVEHDAVQILQTTLYAMRQAVEKAGVHARDIAAISITNQRETTVAWDAQTGIPVCNAIVWQCRRTAPMIDSLKKEGFDRVLLEKTGLIPDAYFSATKLKWILDHVDGSRERARRGELLFGTVDTWLIWNLTGGQAHVTDYTNASRTMLFDIHKLQWDREILERFDIPEEMLPAVRPSSFIYGRTQGCIIGDGIPIAGAAGDQQTALFGQCCFEPGDAKNTYGTGCFLLMNTGKEAVASANGLLTTLTAGTQEGQAEYALEGSVFVAGAAIQWLRDELRILENAAQSEACCRAVEDTGGVYVVPAFTGLGAPYWDPYARGIIVGLTRGVGRDHLIRATVESLAYQTADVIAAMEADSGIALKELKVDGGASANDFLMQFQADILGSGVRRPGCIETTAMGAAYLAGLAVGYWNDREEIRKIWSLESSFEPSMEKEKRERLLKGWKRAVTCSFGWAGEN